VLDVAVGTVKSRCARGRARLLPLVSHLRKDSDESRKASDAPRPDGGDSTGRNPSSGTSVPTPRGAPRKAPRKATRKAQQDTTGSGAVKGGGQA
jgi:RNA polymerase sigma-70 factor (ECF subfamily)